MDNMINWIEPSLESGVLKSLEHCEIVCSKIDDELKSALEILPIYDRNNIENKILERIFDTADTAYRDGFLAAYHLLKAAPSL